MYTIGYFPFLYAAFKYLGRKKAITFILLSGMIGLAAEWLSINYGVVFGGTYNYTNALGPKFFGVPLIVAGYWGAIIFGSMGVSNYFFKSHRSFWDALFTLLVDIPLEHTALKGKLWIWEVKGQYLPAPIGNYVGWFLVAFTVSLIFRKFHPKIFRSKLVVALYVLMFFLLMV